jgi:hypothetical protein
MMKLEKGKQYFVRYRDKRTNNIKQTTVPWMFVSTYLNGDTEQYLFVRATRKTIRRLLITGDNLQEVQPVK